MTKREDLYLIILKAVEAEIEATKSVKSATAALDRIRHQLGLFDAWYAEFGDSVISPPIEPPAPEDPPPETIDRTISNWASYPQATAEISWQGFEWIPVSETTNHLVVLMSAGLPGPEEAAVTIWNQEGTELLAEPSNFSKPNIEGGKGHWWFDRKGEFFGKCLFVYTGKQDRRSWIYPISFGEQYAEQIQPFHSPPVFRDDPPALPPLGPPPPVKGLWPNTVALWFSGGAPNPKEGRYGFEFGIPLAICRRGKMTARGSVNLLQINPIDGDKPSPTFDVSRAVREGYQGVVLDMESGPGGNGFDPRLHEEYFNRCRIAGIPFFGAPKMGFSHFVSSSTHSRLGWSWLQTVRHFQNVTDGLVLWNYSASPDAWFNEMTKLTAIYEYPVWAMSADGNNRSSMLNEAGNMRILEVVGRAYGRWGIFFPHKMPSLTKRYANVANRVLA